MKVLMLFNWGYWIGSSEKILNPSKVLIKSNGLLLKKDATRTIVDMFLNLVFVVG